MTNTSSAPLVETVGGSFEEGLANGYELLARHPAVALQQAETLLRLASDPRVFALAAAALRKLGRDAEAEQSELSAIRASFAIKDLDTAASAANDGHHSEAVSLIETLLRSQPENLLALTMAAELEIEEWKLDRAEKRLQVVVGRAPSFLRAALLLGKCLRSQSRIKEAVAVFEDVLTRKPDNPIALRSAAEAYSEANRHDRSAETYARLLDLDPAQIEIWIMYAQELRILGRKDESIAAFRRALALEPNMGAAWWGLAHYFPSSITSGDIDAMKAAIGSTISSRDAGPLHVALGILAERRGDYAEAFAEISKGKALRARAHPYNSAANSDGVEKLVSVLTPERFAALSGAGSPNESPIFIIGMPRSGTTLLEQILGRHSHIEAAGELPILARLASANDALSAEGLCSITADEATKFGDYYLERARGYRDGLEPRFIDKMNSNWFRVGVIRLMLPNARIIDLRRDALDCCWSNFKMMFAEGPFAANDQRDIARSYRDYVRMVDRIDAAAPGAILKVRYEDLVDDPETQTRRILDFLGLEYEPACVDFHLSTQPVATPSSEQVRRPINREGIGSSGPYRQWLGPMIEELGDLAD